MTTTPVFQEWRHKGSRRWREFCPESGCLTVTLSYSHPVPLPHSLLWPESWVRGPRVQLTVLTRPGGVQGCRASPREHGPQDRVSRSSISCCRVQQKEPGGVLARSVPRVPGGPRQFCPLWLAHSVSRVHSAACPSRAPRLGSVTPSTLLSCTNELTQYLLLKHVLQAGAFPVWEWEWGLRRDGTWGIVTHSGR